MRAAALGLMAAILAGCGVHETRFVPDFADRYCDLVMECSSDAMLTFDGISDHEDCLRVYGPVVDGAGEGCKFKRKRGRKCLKAMELMTCPSEGEELMDSLPDECGDVYTRCDGGFDLEVGGGDTGEAPEDTGEGEDTGESDA